MATKTFYATKDAVMGKVLSGSFSGWNGKDNHIQVGATGTRKWRGVCYFGINFDGMLSITSATLTLLDGPTSSSVHSVQSSPPTELRIARTTADWGEGNVDPGEGEYTGTLDWHWDNMFNKWTTTNSVLANVDQDTIGTEHSFDVTGIVTDWFNGAANYGFMLINSTSESATNKALLFFAREGGTDRRARLDITYEANTAPNLPILTSPIDGDTFQGLVPSFSMTRDDPDLNDYITGATINVFEGGPRYYWSTSTSTAPGTGLVRANNADPTFATALYINETDASGVSQALYLSSIVSGNGVNILTLDADNSFAYSVSSTVDNGTWWTINVSFAGSTGAEPADATEILFRRGPLASSTYGPLKYLWDSGSISVTGNPTSVTVPYGVQGLATPLVGNTYYLWRGSTKDRGGLWSSNQRYATFLVNSPPNTPTLNVTPTPLTAVPTATPFYTLTHNDPDPNDSKMYGYRIIVEGESYAGGADWTTAWDTGDIDVSGTPASTKVITSASLTYGGSYRVKARTKDINDAWSSYSPAVAFTIQSTGVPVNLSPNNNALTPTTPVFSGERSAEAYAITSYEIIVYADDLQTTMWTSAALTSGISGGASFIASYAGSALSAGSYYQWKVRITSTLGVSEYSALNRFQVADSSIPTLSAPLGSAIADLTPTFTGSRVSSFNRMEIELYPATSTSAILGTVIWASGTLSSTIGAGGLGTQFTYDYPGSPALTYATTYKWRARVSADAGANWTSWTGLTPFTTTTAGTPVLTSVAGVSYPTYPWITDSTPDFVITRTASDTIDLMQVRVYNSSGTTLIWDSGMTNVTNGTTGTLTYSGPALVAGRYLWNAKYTAAAGPTGSFSPNESFTLNSPPNIPSEMSPSQGDIVVDTLLPLFSATFSDPDSATLADTPSEWELIVEEDDATPVDTINVTTGLLVGANSYQWTISDTTLVYGTDYRWRSRYQDSKSVWGSYSAYQSFVIRQSPNGTITIPSEGSIVNIATPQVKWTYSGSASQYKFTLDINRTDSAGEKVADVFEQTVISDTPEYTVPAGYLVDNKYYDFTLTVYDTDEIPDPTPSTVNIRVEQNPPDPIIGLSPTSMPSSILLEWDTSIMKTTPVVHKFVAYRIYRRLTGDEEWQSVGDVLNRTTPRYEDWYAGNNVLYQYRVTVVATVVGQDSVEIESPDDPDGGSFCEARLGVDAWMLVGADRSGDHIQELPVTAENHNRVVQQESFETLGSNRKVILRGFVLGHEGSVTCVWTDALVALPNDPQRMYQESVIGRRILDYITNTKGPHILKSPFGDVWDVEFSGPSYQWGAGASLEVTLEWIEVGQTSQVSI